MEEKKKRRKPWLVVGLIVLSLILLVPLACVGLSFIGRISPDSVIPDSYGAFVHVPDPVVSAERLLNHQPLAGILSDPKYSTAATLVTALRESRLLDNGLVRFAGNGTLDGALFSDGSFLLAYDTGVVSPFLRVLPAIVSRLTVPRLYYVNSGRNSRFEYRPETGKTIYCAPYRNVLIVSDSASRLESVLSGQSTGTDAGEPKPEEFRNKGFDVGLLLSTEALLDGIDASDPMVVASLSNIDFSGQAELVLSFTETKLDATVSLPVSTQAPDLQPFLTFESKVPRLHSILPKSTQYSTLFKAENFSDLVRAAVAVSGSQTSSLIEQADSSSKSLFGFGLDELLYSWAGSEVAAFGLEGRPRPVFAIQIANEFKRKAVFESLFASLVLEEDSSVVLDGLRLPQIKLPGFLVRILSLWKITVPTPYYAVEHGYLFLSESPENLLATVTAIRKNEGLDKSDLWKTLSSDGSEKASLSLFYSLDRALPFFLKGNSDTQRILQLYRQGLIRLSIDEGVLSLHLAAIAGAQSGLTILPGFPVELEGNAGDSVIGLLSDKKLGPRLLTVVDRTKVLSFDPAKSEFHSLESEDPVWCVSGKDTVWIVSARGQVTQADGNLKATEGFPVSIGSRPSAAPAFWDGHLYVADSDGSLYRVDSSGGVISLSPPFTETLRSPPSFIAGGKADLMAAYPKSFAGQVWLSEINGAVLPGWPVAVDGISFGSPVLFVVDRTVITAFITQAGNLSVNDSSAAFLPGFPVGLPGLFYIQPVFDGKALWALSSDGVLYRIGLDGSVQSQPIPSLTAESGSLTVYDIDGDRHAEIFVSGDGNQLYGYTAGFSLLAGFPLPVWGKPYFGDLNGDGRSECAGVGLDNRLYCWQFR